VDRIVTLPAEATGSAPGRGVACADRDEGVEGGIARRRMTALAVRAAVVMFRCRRHREIG